MVSWLPIESWRDGVDIALVAMLGWLAIRYFRRTRARAALIGLLVLGVVAFFVRSLDLRLSAAIFQGFFAVLVLVLVVVFQDELRRGFEQLGSLRRPDRVRVPATLETLDLLVRTAARLAETRTGALIVLPGREPLERHLEGGVALGGRVSEPLLLSLFDSSSPGHDGAVVVRGSVIERFSVHLPLSANHTELGPGGTRHAAALGLSERCDATCIVVSEERGTVSVARGGELHALARPEDLVAELRSAFPDEPDRHWWEGKVGMDAAIAVTAALALWLVFVPGSDLSEIVVPARVEVGNLPEGLVLEGIDPPTVDVKLSGLRRDALLVERDDVYVRVDGYLARLGRRTFSISPQDVRGLGSMSVREVQPERVRLTFEAAPDETGDR